MNTTAPTGVVTFLFTDIEGSTRRWEADADAMRAALAAHDAQLRDAIEAHDGWLFKHTGDGVCAAFSSPEVGRRCRGRRAQRALELPVRMGIATGEAELRGGDYFGAVLNRAARVMSAGHGGQILVDGATADLSAQSTSIELGARRLRDIAKPVEISQVRVAGCAPISAAENARRDTGQPAGADDELRRPRIGAGRAGVASQGASLGDPDRRRRSRQDPTGTGSRRAIGTDFPDGVLGHRTRRRSATQPRCPKRSPRSSGSLNSPGMTMATASPQRWRAASDCWCSTTANMFSTQSADMIDAILAHSDT